MLEQFIKVRLARLFTFLKHNKNNRDTYKNPKSHYAETDKFTNKFHDSIHKTNIWKAFGILI